MRSTLAAAALALLASVPAAARAKGFQCPARGGPPWRELASEHFALATDLPPADARRVVADLEQLREALEAALFARPVAARGRLPVVAFARHEQFLEFAPHPDVLGYFERDVLGRERIVLSGGLGASRAVVAHELAHHLALTEVPRQPKWFAEGLATYLGTIRPGSSGADVGAPPDAALLSQLRSGAAPVRRLLSWRSVADDEVSLYASSWLLYHYLADRRPRELAAFQAGLARGDWPTDAWATAFPEWRLEDRGAPERLDGELREYLAAREWRHRSVALLAPGGPRAPLAERVLSSGAVHTLRLDLARARSGRAAEDVDEALREDPGHVAALEVKAEAAPASALELGRRAVAAHPEDPRAWVLFGRAAGGDEGEAALRRAVELAPERLESVVALGEALSNARKPEAALQLATRAVALAPWSTGALLLHGTVLQQLGRCAEGATALDRAFAVIPDMAPRAQRLDLSAEIARAEEQCVAQQRQAGVARAARRELSAVEVEIARLEEVVEREPRHATAWDELGLAYRRAGRLADAARALRTQVDVAPRHPTAWTELGIVAAEQGRLDDAEAAYRRQLQLAPRDGYAHLKLGGTLLDLGRPKEALRELEPVAAAAPDEASVLLAVGRARLAVGQVERGAAALERAVGLDPGASTWEEAARALGDAGADLDDARAWAASAASDLARRLRDAALDAVTGDDVTRSAALVRAWGTLGWIRFQQGEVADAERLLGAAERLQPSASTSERLGRVLDRAGKPQEAERAYARAVALGAAGHARSRLAVLARDEAAAVAAAREDLARGALQPARRPAVRLARAAATPDAEILLVLRADGTIAAVLVTDGAAVDGSEALIGGRHGVAFPDASLPALVARARWRCDASGCAASFAPASAPAR